MLTLLPQLSPNCTREVQVRHEEEFLHTRGDWSLEWAAQGCDGVTEGV